VCGGVGGGQCTLRTLHCHAGQDSDDVADQRRHHGQCKHSGYSNRRHVCGRRSTLCSGSNATELPTIVDSGCFCIWSVD
jgi:hypothetical protein